MPVPTPKIPTITLLPSLPPQQNAHFKYVEREVDRHALVEIAPDREEFLTSDRTVDELRSLLKIRVGSDKEHWLYQAERKVDVKIHDPTVPASLFSPKSAPQRATADFHVIRRVQSFSSMQDSPDEYPSSMLEICNPELSTDHQLISPRPLGPTHSLLVYPIPLSLDRTNHDLTLSRKHFQNTTDTATVTFSELLEVPINDLLFIANVPNFVPFRDDGCTLTLPRRIPGELPRSFFPVPHLDAFSELVVYLHTKNQAELFRKLVPEWVRDVMHPLPTSSSSSPAHNRITSGSYSPVPDYPPVTGLAWIRKKQGVKKPFLGLLRSGSSSSTSVDSLPASLGRRSSLSSFTAEPERTVNAIAQELAQTAPAMTSVPTELPSGNSHDPLVRTASLLDALKDNLEYLGFYSPMLWNELEASREILIRAISIQARMTSG
ncbi:hypothetical protein BDN72DRAFT_839907 [Pluteus cervinus]|uniref:Uncharacterized protein n=1 Tax=Pluteus cervinus TaxID=181527 RepID=A0ACD3AX05_9AGAR|nr:hypothetical protein BDN72DRAFT_839907 [Pluteus cervinus]